ncbi:MAG: mandelate racemase/muconate lactonizing enzyme family protein, partial [Puniceicoccaceae bacterium]
AAAISAIDLALWDLKGKALGQPVWRLLGGKVRDRVEVYVHVGGGDQDSIIRRSLERIREGWRYLRFSVTEAPGGRFDARLEVDRTIELLRAVRQAVGPDIELILDAHTRLEPPDAVRLGRTLEPVRLAFLEDPLRSEYPEGYRGLRRQLGVPLAAGEQYATKWAFRSLVEEDLVDFLRLDLCNVGGLTEAAKIAGWAELHQQRIVPHNPLSPISSAACLHFAIATENVCLVEAGRTDDAFLRDLFPTRPAFPPAAWPAPDAPGLGVELDDAALASHPFRDGSCPRFHRPDGSFTNW